MNNRYLSENLIYTLFIFALLDMTLTSCNTVNVRPGPTRIQQYTLQGGGNCVTLGAHPKPPFLNIRASHDAFQAYSETMLAEDPHSPLHLVGGAKYFPDIAH